MPAQTRRAREPHTARAVNAPNTPRMALAVQWETLEALHDPHALHPRVARQALEVSLRLVEVEDHRLICVVGLHLVCMAAAAAVLPPVVVVAADTDLLGLTNRWLCQKGLQVLGAARQQMTLSTLTPLTAAHPKDLLEDMEGHHPAEDLRGPAPGHHRKTVDHHPRTPTQMHTGPLVAVTPMRMTDTTNQIALVLVS